VQYRPNLYDDPQVRALEMMWELQNRELGGYKTPGHPIRFSKTPVRPGKGAPVLGQDSAAVLAEAGFGADEIAALQRAEIVK
jgi:crotonobetainyl-CoA:carnitine CoA-transferase CaiB-like acyl-CoA transferase